MARARRRIRREVLQHLQPATTAPAVPHFGPALAALTLRCALGPDLEDNVDPVRHPEGPPPGMPADAAAAVLGQVTADPDLEWFYTALEDDVSRDLMLHLFAFRLLGATKVRLPLSGGRSGPEVWAAARELLVEEGTVDLGFLGWRGDRYDLSPLGTPFVLETHSTSIPQLLLDQYRSPQHPHVGAQPGDVVLEAGGAWGDTALHVASVVGETGRVHSFEFEPNNLERFARNLELNPELAPRIQIDRRALWHRSGERLAIVPFGPASRVGEGEGGELGIPSVAIDDLGLARLDMLKLDIEGAELDALKGARRTLLRDRPRLAISLYHRPEDWTTIPRFIDSLGVGYRFSLGHFTVHSEETVLFAWTD